MMYRRAKEPLLEPFISPTHEDMLKGNALTGGYLDSVNQGIFYRNQILVLAARRILQSVCPYDSDIKELEALAAPAVPIDYLARFEQTYRKIIEPIPLVDVNDLPDWEEEEEK